MTTTFEHERHTGRTPQEPRDGFDAALMGGAGSEHLQRFPQGSSLVRICSGVGANAP